MIQMELAQLLISENRDEQVILLREVEGARTFPIVIGSYEAITLNRKLNNAKTPRPLTHDLIENILKGLNAAILRVEVTQLKNNTFYAHLVLKQNGLPTAPAGQAGQAEGSAQSGGQEIEVDARPSDAIILATQSGAPIYVNEEVLVKLKENKTEE